MSRKEEQDERLNNALRKLLKIGLLDPNDMKYASIEVRDAEKKMKEQIVEMQKKSKLEKGLKNYLKGMRIISR